MYNGLENWICIVDVYNLFAAKKTRKPPKSVTRGESDDESDEDFKVATQTRKSSKNKPKFDFSSGDSDTELFDVGGTQGTVNWEISVESKCCLTQIIKLVSSVSNLCWSISFA